jgi:hypothetical protein
MVQPHTVPPPPTSIVVGVDTHKYVHVAVAIDRLGTRLDARSVSADRAGYTELVLVAWARTLGHIEAFGIGPVRGLCRPVPRPRGETPRLHAGWSLGA